MTKPVWLRVSPAIRQLILGEVERQYHPIGTGEYKERVEWMTDAWQWALDRFTEGRRRPRVLDVLYLSAMIEPEKNAGGYRTRPVYIGGREAPKASGVHRSMELLFDHIADVIPVQGRGGQELITLEGDMTADDFYLEFEHIHPFIDGNGRTGKILHNWILGTLDDPVLIADYFGGGNP